MHRSHEGTNIAIHAYWYDDRIEINSPGGPYGEVSAENFGQPGLVAYRNPLLAEAMRVLNLVQRRGAGLPIARRELRANEQPGPLFNDQGITSGQAGRQYMGCVRASRHGSTCQCGPVGAE